MIFIKKNKKQKLNYVLNIDFFILYYPKHFAFVITSKDLGNDCLFEKPFFSVNQNLVVTKSISLAKGISLSSNLQDCDVQDILQILFR